MVGKKASEGLFDLSRTKKPLRGGNYIRQIYCLSLGIFQNLHCEEYILNQVKMSSAFGDKYYKDRKGAEWAEDVVLH